MGVQANLCTLKDGGVVLAFHDSERNIQADIALVDGQLRVLPLTPGKRVHTETIVMPKALEGLALSLVMLMETLNSHPDAKKIKEMLHEAAKKSTGERKVSA